MTSIAQRLAEWQPDPDITNEDDLYKSLERFFRIKQGCMVTRVDNSAQPGFPDVLIITPGSTTLYCELKISSKPHTLKLTQAQAKYMHDLAWRRAKVFILHWNKTTKNLQVIQVKEKTIEVTNNA